MEATVNRLTEDNTVISNGWQIKKVRKRKEASHDNCTKTIHGNFFLAFPLHSPSEGNKSQAEQLSAIRKGILGLERWISG